MTVKKLFALIGLASLVAAAQTDVLVAAPADDRPSPAKGKVTKAQVDSLVGSWPAKPKSVAYQMIKKYGLPSEASPSQLVWLGNGPWKRTIVGRTEFQHHFPKPHTDIMEQVIDYRVPADKLDELAAYDGSVIAERTAGELSARCDMEEMNFLALNLANDIVTNKKSVAEARKAYAETVVAFMTEATPPAATTKLLFEVARSPAGDPDEVTLPGAPQPAAAGPRQPPRAGETLNDGSIVAVLITANSGEIMSAKFALQASKDGDVRRLAEMLRADHAKGLQQFMALGTKAELRPMENPLSRQLQEEGATGMAKLAQLDGMAFDQAFVQMMAEKHQKTLNLIDTKLLPAAKSDALKQQLTATRAVVAMHLEEARKLSRR